MTAEWEIKGRSHHCTATGRKFGEGELFYTLLFLEKGGGFRREDLSVEAWEAREEEPVPFSFWKSKYEPPAPPKAEALRANDAEGLLRQLIEQGAPETKNARFILAAMLERKRKLRPMPSETPGLLVYEVPSSGEVLLVEDPGLTLEQIPAVQQEVAALLVGGPLG